MSVLLLTPMLGVLLFTLAWFSPITTKYVQWLVKENHPVEMLTFIFLMVGSILGAYLAYWIKSEKREAPIIGLFLFLFSFGLFVIAMEEISWGQQFLGFLTPDSLNLINEQNETNLHNIKGLQGNSEYFHLFFGLAGAIGVWLNLFILNKVRVPLILSTWFLTIVAVSAVDLYNDFVPFEPEVGYFLRRLSEVNEMMIGFTAFAYVLLLSRKFRKPAPPASLESKVANEKFSPYMNIPL
ncbi:hypothetical protein [Pontibacter akesuensis]|uniref:hypothetical protein n=1 Tax=Pontibacter akesuensis TaxID=388950 RepID=UPI0012F9BB6F|nr:hypothetical protein [Pontibacter akesuensis]